MAGILLADIRGETKLRYSPLRIPFIKIMDFIQNVLNLDRAYNEANKKMMKQYSKSFKADGEIIFLAVNPKLHGRGIGSLLLAELEKSIKVSEKQEKRQFTTAISLFAVFYMKNTFHD